MKIVQIYYSHTDEMIGYDGCTLEIIKLRILKRNSNEI